MTEENRARPKSWFPEWMLGTVVPERLCFRDAQHLLPLSSSQNYSYLGWARNLQFAGAGCCDVEGAGLSVLLPLFPVLLRTNLPLQEEPTLKLLLGKIPLWLHLCLFEVLCESFGSGSVFCLFPLPPPPQLLCWDFGFPFIGLLFEPGLCWFAAANSSAFCSVTVPASPPHDKSGRCVCSLCVFWRGRKKACGKWYPQKDLTSLE